jgi:protease-4
VSQEEIVKKKYYLELHLKEEIVEGRPEYTFFTKTTKTALLDVLDMLQLASRARRVAALVLTLENLDLGWARISNLRRALELFRGAGKRIFCYLVRGGNAEYYLATACDHILMSPASDLHLVGLTAETFFFRQALDRFGIQAQIRGVGQYKSAAETLTRSTMSAPAREQLEALLDDHYEEFCRSIREGRHWSQEDVVSIINGGPYTAREAAQKGLIDGMCYQDELEEKLQKYLGEKVKPRPAQKYRIRDGFFRRLLTYRRPRIAVIDILGLIVSGESRRDRFGRHISGEETVKRFLQHAKKSNSIRAVVLRVDSRGGTGLASDQLWREISLLREKKPVVASLGDVAASGGYYVSSAATAIMAEKTSIAGSIGVLGGKVVARELMAQLSINRESVRRGTHADYSSLFAAFTPEDEKRLELQLEEFYRENFLKKVALGRQMEETSVDEAGQGRIWSGQRSHTLHLTDKIGGVLEAIEEARKLAGIPPQKKIRRVHYLRRRHFREMLAPEFVPHLGLASLPQATLEMLDLLELTFNNDVLLWTPFRISIR